MVLSLSAVVLLAALTLLLLRFAGLRAWHAVVCILLGFFLASSALGPYIHDAAQAIASGADLLVFLDVDCIPSHRLTAAYHRAARAAKASAPRVFCGPVGYLPPLPSRAVAEEVVQEAWLAVLKGLAGFEGRSSLRRWVFGILTNCAKARGTREARSVPFSSVGSPENEDEPVVDPSRFLPPDHPRWPGHWSAPPVAWADEKLMQQESLQAAQRAIDQLPRSQREVIVLRDVEGWESNEVCELLGLTEVNQRVLLHRARSKVRAALELHFQAGGRR